MQTSEDLSVYERVFSSKQSLQAAIEAQQKILAGNLKRLEMFKQLYQRYENE